MKISMRNTRSNRIMCRVHLAGSIALTSNNFCGVYMLPALCEHLPGLALEAISHGVGKQRALVCLCVCVFARVQIHLCADSLLVCVDRDELGNPPSALTFHSLGAATADGCEVPFPKTLLGKKEVILQIPLSPKKDTKVVSYFQKFTGFNAKIGNLKSTCIHMRRDLRQ